MTSIRKTQRPSYANLVRENDELKARVAELESEKGPISIDPLEGVLAVQDLRVGPLSVETARVRAPRMRKATRDLEKVETWLNGGKDSLQNFAEGPIVVDRLKAKIPLPFVNSLMEKIAGDQMSRAGLSDVSLGQGRGNSLRLRGNVKKGIKLPFEVNGALSTTEKGEVKFSLQSSKLGGLPMPNFLVSLATKFAGDGLADAGVKIDGQDFTLDPRDLKPKNIFFRLDSLDVQDGAILIDGSAPITQGKSNIPKISRKKA